MLIPFYAFNTSAPVFFGESAVFTEHVTSDPDFYKMHLRKKSVLLIRSFKGVDLGVD